MKASHPHMSTSPNNLSIDLPLSTGKRGFREC